MKSPIATSSRKDHQSSFSQSIEYQVNTSPAARLSSIAQVIQVHLRTESFHCSSIRMHEQEHIDTDLDEEEHLSTTTEDAEELADPENDALSEVASSLCSVCRRLFQSEFIHDEIYSHHPSLSSLKESVDAGCRSCEILARRLGDRCKRIPSEWSIICTVMHVRNSESLNFEFFLKRCDSSNTSLKGSQILTTFYLYPACKLGLGLEFSDSALKTSNTKSPTCINMYRSWYKQCLDHTTCRSWKSESKVLPTRLIRINKPGNAGISANLCETKDLLSGALYTTLSHCWGSGVIFKLLQSNLDELKQHIPINRLPKVFQDAMYVSIEIGICYIWIDSLCIIQDSKDQEDWTRESRRMGDVYTYGEFNIAATGYKDGSSGLFSEREALLRIYPSVSLQCVVRGDAGYKRSFDGIYVDFRSFEFDHQIIQGPLNNRAWVAQERILSPAVLHFTPEHVWWECSSLLANEGFSPCRHNWYYTKDNPAGVIRSLNTESNREDVYSFWRNFISYYAGAEMTFEQDRFPGAAGIAGAIGELIDDNLIAGIWEGDLIRSLIMTRHATVSSIPSAKLAPSWSWASFKAKNTLAGRNTSHVKPLKGVQIQVLSDFPGFKSDLQPAFIQETGVHGLAIRGPLRRLVANFNKHLFSGFIKALGKLAFVDKAYDNKEATATLGVLTKNQMWRWDDPTHMLLLAKQLFSGNCRVFGLLIQPVPDEPNTFRRSGTVQYRFPSEDVANEYLGLQEKDGEYESSSFFAERGLQELILI